MEKKALREKFRKYRSSLTAGDIEEKSRAVTARLLTAVDWQTVTTVHCYETMPKLSEVNTNYFLRALMEKYPRVKVIKPEDTSNPKGVKCDVVIVPVLAFDNKGNRLGMGGGYYDKLLSKLNVLSIGLCYEDCHVDQLPAEPHDIRLNVVVTEEAAYDFRRHNS